jgi:hypothetical protein
MNEIIKELIDRCTTHYNGGLGTEIEVFDKEKFAQLIVGECIWRLMVLKEEAIDNDWNVDETMSIAISDISEHFGVEE